MIDNNVTTFIGIDTGTTQSGYVVIDIEDKFKIIDKNIVDNDAIFNLIKSYKNKNVCVLFEMICSFRQRIGESTISTIFWIGRLYQCCVERNITVELISRRDLKKILCPGIKAKDKHIRARMIELFGEPGKKDNQGMLYKVKSHEWQALATCIAYFIREGIEF